MYIILQQFDRRKSELTICILDGTINKINVMYSLNYLNNFVLLFEMLRFYVRFLMYWLTSLKQNQVIGFSDVHLNE